jgi:hypothetical protein
MIRPLKIDHSSQLGHPPHQECTRSAIRLNPLRDLQERLRGIVLLIALNGPLRL